MNHNKKLHKEKLHKKKLNQLKQPEKLKLLKENQQHKQKLQLPPTLNNQLKFKQKFNQKLHNKQQLKPKKSEKMRAIYFINIFLLIMFKYNSYFTF